MFFRIHKLKLLRLPCLIASALLAVVSFVKRDYLFEIFTAVKTMMSPFKKWKGKSQNQD